MMSCAAHLSLLDTGNHRHILRWRASGAALLLSSLLVSGVQADLGTSSSAACSVVNGETQVVNTHLCTFCKDGYEMFRWGLDVGGVNVLEEGVNKLCTYLGKYTQLDCSEFVDNLLKKEVSYFDTVTPTEFCVDIDACHCAQDKATGGEK